MNKFRGKSIKVSGQVFKRNYQSWPESSSEYRRGSVLVVITEQGAQRYIIEVFVGAVNITPDSEIEADLDTAIEKAGRDVREVITELAGAFAD